MSGDDDAGRSGSGTHTAPTMAAEAKDIDSHARTALSGTEDTELGESDGGETADEELSQSGDDLLGTTLQKRYQITRKIGQGGMGAVYEATHVALGKKVAIKVLLDKYASKDRVVARLEQEARLASSIGHDNIVDITDFGETAAGRTFVVMEFLEGESLSQLLAREAPLDGPRAIKIARQVASALGAAHKKGIIHRDIKPENVFLRRRDNRDIVKVVDFGISKSMRPEEGAADSPRLTQTGMVLGTPLYMSPEQARGDEDPDHRIDIYSLGVILYEMVTGEVPFRGNNYLNIVSQVISSEPKAPRELNPEVSEDLEAVILKALEKEPEERYQTMEELDVDLAVLAGGDMASTSARITASRRRRKRKGGRRFGPVLIWVGAAVAIASLVVIAVMLATGRGGDSEAALASPVPVDAAVATQPEIEIDAGPAPPEFEMVDVKLVSEPKGATVYRDARVEGKTPRTLQFLKKDKQVDVILELDGYDDARATINPVEDEGKTIHIKLTRARHRRPHKLHHPGKGDFNKDKGKKHHDPGHSNGGGDLTPPVNL